MKYLVFHCPICKKELRRVLPEYLYQEARRILSTDVSEHFLEEHTRYRVEEVE